MTGKDIDRYMFCFFFNNYVYHKLKAVEQKQSAGSRKFQGPVRKFGLDSGLDWILEWTGLWTRVGGGEGVYNHPRSIVKAPFTRAIFP